MSNFPRVHLALDSCFAIKRWPRPAEWGRIIQQEIGGIRCIEMSTDLDIDPQFNTRSFRKDWLREVKDVEKSRDLKVVSFYSGYATYRALGLLSWDAGVQQRLIRNYFMNVVDLARELNAQVGNTLHAFSEETLNDPAGFLAAEKTLSANLVKMARYAGKNRVGFGYEQMYTPNQGWWRQDDCERYLADLFKQAGYPVYLTIDTAHMAGQSQFVFPEDHALKELIETKALGNYRFPDEIAGAIVSGTTPEKIKALAKKYHYYFCRPEDGDVYQWLERLGCYSPLMHLQQTDGTYSAHKPFTKAYNENGIIHPGRVLEAIARSYEKPPVLGMPPRAEDIYLAFELFFGITESPGAIIRQVKESVEYWRQVIKTDGEPIDRWL